MFIWGWAGGKKLITIFYCRCERHGCWREREEPILQLLEKGGTVESPPHEALSWSLQFSPALPERKDDRSFSLIDLSPFSYIPSRGLNCYLTITTPILVKIYRRISNNDNPIKWLLCRSVSNPKNSEFTKSRNFRTRNCSHKMVIDWARR